MGDEKNYVEIPWPQPDTELADLRSALLALVEAAEGMAESIAKVGLRKSLWCDHCNSTGYHEKHCSYPAFANATRLAREKMGGSK